MEIDEEKILSGKIVSKKIKEDLKIEVDKLKEKGIIPKLAVIMVGDDEASKVYVRNKKIEPEKVAEIIESKKRENAGKTLPPNGLYLLKVIYE